MNKPIPRHMTMPGHPGVTVIDGGDARPPLVSTLGAFSRLDMFETDRYQRLAALQQRKIVIVETPGWTKGTRLDGLIRAELRAGNFRGIGRLMGESATEAGALGESGELSVLGYSMGCSTATATAHWLVDQGLSVRHLTLVEPVALTPRKPATLMAVNTWEGFFSARHMRENRDLTDLPIPSAANWGDHRRIPEPLHLLWALSRGRLEQQVTALAKRRHGLGVTLIRGGASQLVSHRDMQTLAEALRPLCTEVDLRVVTGAHHALWHSRPMVGRLAAAIG